MNKVLVNTHDRTTTRSSRKQIKKKISFRVNKTVLIFLASTSCLHANWFNGWFAWLRGNSDNKPHTHNPLKRDILHAPHRESYAQGRVKVRGCVFCNKVRRCNDKRNLVIRRFAHHIVALNKYPYSKGHILIIPKRHVKCLDELTHKEKKELMTILCKAPKIVKEALRADGVNVGINLGKTAGASIPNHLHIHVVPRYNRQNPNHSGHGFLEALGSKLIPWRLSRVYNLLKRKFGNLGRGKK